MLLVHAYAVSDYNIYTSCAQAAASRVLHDSASFGVGVLATLACMS